ncbi:hypothetical protein [Roseburia sp. 831b]|uniref:hypothetical protein n=1 Tax=Roseburia sp. 831b TaxID=1261635 RepID=UPI0009516AC0|nr:hypothetical protein [Roseburia sp. 831b]WVK74251.1 hypothetical protein BIV16_06970 [Roseburia sp. 831b]
MDKIDKERPQTNADQIRSMTDDELANAFMQCSNISMSKNDWLRWLQEESEEKHGTGGRTMGRLIDADAFERSVMRSDAEDMQDVIYALRDYPTAYDPDKVVQQLEDRKSLMLETLKISEADIDRGRIYGMDKAIEIVKGGGVDAN